MKNKHESANEIMAMVESFCDPHLNDELTGCALRLCDKLSRKRKLDITRGRKEIWAAAIVYVIARLNFLFDKETVQLALGHCYAPSGPESFSCLVLF